jgi:hypothetical protein
VLGLLALSRLHVRLGELRAARDEAAA